jgi:hypothetical protein
MTSLTRQDWTTCQKKAEQCTRRTSDNCVRPEGNNLVVEFLRQTQDVVIIRLVRVLEALRIGWRDFMEIFLVEDGLVCSATRGVARELKCTDRVAVIGEVT